MNTEQDIIDTYGEDWEAKADALRNVLSELPKTECQNCENGTSLDGITFIDGGAHSFKKYKTCSCCNGDYLNCPNCADEKKLDDADIEAMHNYLDEYLEEGTGNDTADLLASMR